MRIPAYCSMQFLTDVTTSGSFDFFDPAQSATYRNHSNMLELIANGLQIETDVDEDEISKNASNPYVKHLIKNLKISSKIVDFKSFRENENEYLSRQHKNPVTLYLLSDLYKSRLSDYQKMSGITFLAPNSNFSGLFEERIQNFIKGADLEWEFAKKFLEPHHSLVIADPYVFTKDGRNCIEQLLQSIQPNCLRSMYHVSLLGYDASHKNKKDLPTKRVIENWATEQRKGLFGTLKANLEIHIVNNDGFHDRYIITNNNLIFSGYGINVINKGKTTKEGTWVSLPPYKTVKDSGNNPILFYKIMRDKLEILKKWIAPNTTSNPLLK